MSRLPESRLLALRANASEAAERAFSRPTIRTELFSSSSANRGTRNRLISLQIGETPTLKPKAILAWPDHTDALCLHCAEKCPSTPLPAVKYYDAHEDKFWVYGFFCRPCCSLAYVQEHPNTDTHRCLIWTQNVLRLHFGVQQAMVPAPPRAALKKFGGKLSLDAFYGNDGTQFKAMHTPPFVTFAMYAELTQKVAEVDTKSVHGLRRPKEPSKLLAEAESTEKPPLILEYLARRGALSVQAKVEEPKKRKVVSTKVVEHEPLATGGGLSKYLMKS